ncbi:MAG: DNA polymerase III subunit epsilon [Methylococcales bacterium]|jgi:DNA polymerase-3 subunit epsilon|nr:DNA polymerase III subunit epsilon [Methylococcales bacterium]
MTKSNISNRIVVLDTETTGLSTREGHRIIEIGCVELINRRLTGKRFHAYLNPERKIDDGAIAVHGISNEFLDDKPLFKQISAEFIAFIKNAELVIHNAPFDVGFINNEFSRLDNHTETIADFCLVFDTLVYARKKHPGQRNSLDALCKRYGIDNSHRELHGALLDAEILAEVFLLMTGGQSSLIDDAPVKVMPVVASINTPRSTANRPALSVVRCNEEELSAHQISLDTIESCLWNQ